MAGVDAVNIFLRFVLADGSEAGAFRLVPRWEPPPPKPRRAVPLDAVPALPAEALPASVGHAILTMDGRGESMGPVMLAPSLPEHDSQNLKRQEFNCWFDIGINPSDGQATVRFYDVDSGGLCWRSTGLYYMDSISDKDDKNPTAHVYSCVEEIFATDVHFSGGSSLQISFPPLRLNFKKNFKCEATIGAGTEGKVYRCLSLFTPHLCAVKETHPDQFLMEYTGTEPADVKILSMSNHDNVVEIFLSWSEQKKTSIFGTGAIFTSMKLYDRSLKQYMNGEEFDLEERKYIFRQIMSGIEFMHQYHIAHRDIKPGNILIGENLNVKIVDFGIAKINQAPNFYGFPSGCYGSKPYRTPEILNAYMRHSEKVDIFSAGILYYEMFVPRLNERWEKVNKLSELITEGVPHFTQLDEDFSLDTVVDGTTVLDDWRGCLPVLKRMVKPKADERPSASEILELLHLHGTGSDVQQFGFILS